MGRDRWVYIIIKEFVRKISYFFYYWNRQRLFRLNFTKNTTGRPTQIFVRRLATSTEITLWPVPDATMPYTLLYYRLKFIDGLVSGIGGDVTTIPPRFVPALVAGLAYHIAAKKPQSQGMVPMLKQEYEEQFALAADEDRDRSSVSFVPASPWSY